MSGKVFDADSPAGVPTFRNGGQVIGAFPIDRAGAFVVLVHEQGCRYVTATTRTGEEGWNAGRYHTYSYLDDDTDGCTDEALKCRSRATADFLVRCAGLLSVAGAAYFVNALAVREPALMDQVTGVAGAAWMTGEAGQRLADTDADAAERLADAADAAGTAERLADAADAARCWHFIACAVSAADRERVTRDLAAARRAGQTRRAELAMRALTGPCAVEALRADPRHILSMEPTDAEREHEENARYSELGTGGWPMG